MAALNKICIVADSFGRGSDPTIWSFANYMKSALTAAGHTATFVGNNLAWPGSVPVCANGGRTFAAAQTDLPNVVAAAPDRVFVSLGINDIGNGLTNLGTVCTNYLNALETAIGTDKFIYFIAPVELDWLQSASPGQYMAITTAAMAWCAAQPTRRKYGTFADAAINMTTDSIGDGTHMNASGAGKLGVVAANVVISSLGAVSSSTIDVAIADMAGVVDAFPTGLNPNAGWSKGAAVQMGRHPSGRAAPSWWPGPTSAMNDTTWTRLQGWWYINVTAESKRANNGRIQVRNVRNYIQRLDTGAWVLLGETQLPGANYYPADGSGAPTGPVAFRTTDPGGGKSFKFDANTANKNIHGYGVNSNDISAYNGNIKNVMITIEARLIKDDAGGVDDLDDMKLMMMAGADYYPDANASNSSLGVTFMPGVGCNRFKWLTREWQIGVFWASRNARGGEGVDNAAILTRDDRTVTEADFRASNPPFSLDTVTVPGTFTLDVPSPVASGSVIRARVTDPTGAAVAGATLTWVGTGGGTIYNTTNSAGVATVRVGGEGNYTLKATSGASTHEKSITVQAAPATPRNKSTDPENITASSWELEGTGNVRTADVIVDIYGTTKFDTYKQGTGTPALNKEYLGFSTLSSKKTVSRFFKRGSLDWISFRLYFGLPTDNKYVTKWFNLATGAVGGTQVLGGISGGEGTIENWGNDIYRCSVSGVGVSNNGSMRSQLRMPTADNGFTFTADAIVGMGADQAEEGDLTAYSPNSTAAAVAPVVQPKTLLSAVNGAAYNETITCSGSTPITWSITGALPAGLTANLSTTGLTLSISGTCTDTTNKTFSVQALNSAGSDSESFTIPVAHQSAPGKPTLTVVNSDTLTITLGTLSTEATHVEVYATQTLPTALPEVFVGRFPKGEFPKQITDLKVAATYTIRLLAANALTTSGFSPASDPVKLHRLFVYAHVSPTAQAVADCLYQIGPPLAAGDVWPSGTYGKGVKSFDAGLVTYNGSQHARMTVELSEQLTPKLRNAQPATMMITKSAAGKSTPILTTTVSIVEGV